MQNSWISKYPIPRTTDAQRGNSLHCTAKSQSQIFRYGRGIFCLPHRPNFSDDFDLCLHWVSVVRACGRSSEIRISLQFPNIQTALLENCWTSEKKWKRFQKVSSFNYEFCITCQDTREVLGHSWLSRSDL